MDLIAYVSHILILSKGYQMELYNTVVLITGGAHGIGRALCRAFKIEGARVAVADLDIVGARKIADEIQGLALRVDVSKEAEIVAAVDQVERELARKQTTLLEVEAERDQAKQNLARAKNDEQYQAVAAVFDELCKKASVLISEITAAEQQLNPVMDADSAMGANFCHSPSLPMEVSALVICFAISCVIEAGV